MILPDKYSYLEMHADLEKALDILTNTNDNMCIIGPSGTGKTAFLSLITDRQIYPHNTITCCPTGIAAVNASTEGIKAQTIHSLFRFPPMSIIPVNRLKVSEDKVQMFRALHTLVIDEISMVNSDLLTKIVHLLNMYRDGEPVRFILLGDPSQLAPILSTNEERNYMEDMYDSKFFFGADMFKYMHLLYFNKIFRQKDMEFKEVLNRFRHNEAILSDYAYLNEKVVDYKEFIQDRDAVYIAMTNKTVDKINDRYITANPNPEKVYYGIATNFNERIVPQELILKEGAQVMIVANNMIMGYFNGLLGKVSKLNNDSIEVVTNKGTVTITQYTWEKYTFKYDKETKEITAKVTGKYSQFPVKVAHAMTSHKTQGLTLENIYLDLERGTFSSGQLYTSLSRVTSIDGLGLARPIKKRDSKLSREVKKFYKSIDTNKEVAYDTKYDDLPF